MTTLVILSDIALVLGFLYLWNVDMQGKAKHRAATRNKALTYISNLPKPTALPKALNYSRIRG
jgi:hypothetical protein